MRKKKTDKEKAVERLDFTESHYRDCVRCAKDYYRFIFFEETNAAAPWILWRHDIDVSPEQARVLAEIEAAEGVKSTFFIHLRSPFYSVFEESTTKIFNDIVLMGHRIGLHYDIASNMAAATERTILGEVLNVRIWYVSQHNPPMNISASAPLLTDGMINAYYFIGKDIGYVSDSNGFWSHERLMDVLKGRQYERLQVLTHPVWWQDPPSSPRARIEDHVNKQRDRVLAKYDKTLEEAGRKNVV